MKRALTTALLAVAALLVVAGGASAQAAEYRSERSPTFLGGSQVGTNVLTLSGGTAKCKTVEFKYNEGWYSQSSASLALRPVMSECTAFGLKVNVSTSGCYYRFNQPISSGTGWKATTDIVCDPGKAIRWEIPAAACEVTIPPQALAGHTGVSVSGAGPTRSYDLTFELSGIAHQSTGGFCGSSGGGGTLTGKANIKGYRHAGLIEQAGVFIQ